LRGGSWNNLLLKRCTIVVWHLAVHDLFDLFSQIGYWRNGKVELRAQP